MAVKNRSLQELDDALEEKSDRPSLLGGAKGSDNSKVTDGGEPFGKTRKKRAGRLSMKERANMRVVQTYLTEEEWRQLKIKAVSEGITQDALVYRAIMDAVK